MKNTDTMTEDERLVAAIMNACRHRSNSRAMAFAFLQELLCEHRTIQQNFFTMIKLIVEEYAAADYDLRNEASVKWSKGAVKADTFPHMEFPYV